MQELRGSLNKVCSDMGLSSRPIQRNVVDGGDIDCGGMAGARRALIGLIDMPICKLVTSTVAQDDG